MTPNFLEQAWRELAPGLGNHLWQSTIFAAAAAGLALALRGNQARTRYWLWLAASLKFLFPFSLLVSIGSYLAVPQKPTATRAVFSSAFDQFGQPFAPPSFPAVAHAAPTAISVNPAANYLPLLLIVWLLGSLAVLLIWLVRWRRISAIAKTGIPLQEGPAATIVAQLQENDAEHEKVAIVSTSATIEPGIFGIFRPVLLWPATISGQLTEAHTESIVAHELCHVRRRDNLTATLHMLVESLFWFHPAVWWLGNRLVEDRERACDEAVVESGREPHVYAESILKVCEFCVESPLPCVPGVSGADLKRRIASIMTHRPARALSLSRKVLVGAAIILAIAAPILAGALRTPVKTTVSATVAPKYSSVSIAPSKPDAGNVELMFSPDQFVSKNATLLQVIRAAYGVEDDRIANAPAWLVNDKYDFVATTGASMAGKSVEESAQYQRMMLIGVLAERLKLEAHYEVRDFSAYALSIARSGPKLKAAKPEEAAPDSMGRRIGIHVDGTTFAAQSVPIDALVFHLSRQLHRTVLNETGLSGNFDFTLKAPDGVAIGIDNSVPPPTYEAALSSALTEQLGLTLEPRLVKMEVLVIDHVEKPTTADVQNVAPEIAPHYENVAVKLDEQGTDSLKTGNGVIRQRMQLIPGEFHGENNSLREMIRIAFGIRDYQIFGAPDWISTELFDVDAKAKESVIRALKNLSDEQDKATSRAMLQQLLADQFQLQAHFERKQLPAYSLVVSNPGKLREANSACDPPTGKWPQTRQIGEIPCGELSTVGNSRIAGTKAAIEQLAGYLSQITGRSVEDKTNLTGRYDIDFSWEPQYRVDRMLPLDHTEPANPSLLAAVQDQVGLKLEPQTAPLNLLVIDHVQRPGAVSARR